MRTASLPPNAESSVDSMLARACSIVRRPSHDQPSPDAVKLAGQILAVIDKRDPITAMHALLICMRTVDMVGNPKNDITMEAKP